MDEAQEVEIIKGIIIKAVDSIPSTYAGLRAFLAKLYTKTKVIAFFKNGLASQISSKEAGKSQMIDDVADLTAIDGKVDGIVGG